jgi:DNA modification methylase
MTVSLVPLEQLTPAPWNPRHIDKARLKNLAESIRADPNFLLRRPILAQQSGEIYAGNQRWHAAKLLFAQGWTPPWETQTVPADLDDVPDQLARERALRDNNAWGAWDDDSLARLLGDLRDSGADTGLLGFDDRELSQLLSRLGDGRELNPDDADLTPPEDPVTKRGDLWVLGDHRLLCGDSMVTVDELLDGEPIACTFTSPPYAVGVDYGDTYTDTIDALRSLLPKLATVAGAHTLVGGFAAVNFNDVAAGHDIAEIDSSDPCEYPMAVEYWPVFRDAGWLLHTRRIWAKPHARVWSPWAIQSCRAASDWEHLWVWKRPGKAITTRGERTAFGVWDTSRDEGVDIGKDEHGAGMATSFARWSLEAHSRLDDVIWEPFAGTGTTLIAAEQTTRRCFAGEINPAYCDVIVRRWERVSGRQAYKKNT